MKIEKILAGIDLGADTEKVLAYASFLAKGLGASLHVLYVIDFLVTPPAYLARYLEEEKRNAEKIFAGWKEKLQQAGVPAVMEVMVGRLHESFETAIERAEADMLVIGFRTHALRRSSSEKLIKGLEMPILVVRGEKARAARIGSVKIENVLCPVDFSDISKKALKTADEMGRSFPSQLNVLHVLPSHIIREKIAAGKDRDRITGEMLDQARNELSNFLKGAGIAKEGTITEGEPAAEIVSFSSEKNTDLVILGARGHSFIRGILIGSVTDAVLKSSPCPVLLIH